MHIDHVFGAKLSSQEIYVTMCNNCNQFKYSKTKEQILAIKDLDNRVHWELLFDDTEALINECN